MNHCPIFPLDQQAAADLAPARLGYDDQLYFPVGPAVRQRLRARLGFHGNVVLAIVGGVADRALDALITSFALVARRDPAATLHLALVGPSAATTVRRQAGIVARRIGAVTLLRRRVRVSAAPPMAERPDLYRAADVFGCAGGDARNETAALEAMACGTPTVLSAQGELQRTFTFGRHALHADPADPVDFGLTLMKVLRHPRLRARLARMGAHQARSFFARAALARIPAIAQACHPTEIAPAPLQASA